MYGLRNFFLTKIDNHCALVVGHLNEGIKSFEVRGPNVEDRCSEV